MSYFLPLPFPATFPRINPALRSAMGQRLNATPWAIHAVVLFLTCAVPRKARDEGTNEGVIDRTYQRVIFTTDGPAKSLNNTTVR